MNAALQALVLAYEAVCNAQGGDDAKRLEAEFQERMQAVLRTHPGLDPFHLQRAVELAHSRWLRAQRRFPTV